MTTTKTNTEENLEKEVDYKALYIQTLADYQNLQRRSLEEKRAIAKQASNDMLLKVLHIYHSAKAGLKYNEKGAFLLYNAFVKFLNDNDIGIINTDFFANKTDNKFSEDWAVAISIKSPEEDKARIERINVLNGAESTIYNHEKTLESVKDKITEEQKSKLDEALENLKSVYNVKDEDRDLDAIKAAQENYFKTWYEVSEALNKQEPPADSSANV